MVGYCDTSLESLFKLSLIPVNVFGEVVVDDLVRHFARETFVVDTSNANPNDD